MRGNCKVAKLLTAAQSCRSSTKSNCPLLANNQSTERRESFSKKAAPGRLFLLFLFRVKLPHLFVEFIVDMLAKPFFAAGFHRALGREPFHAAVLLAPASERHVSSHRGRHERAHGQARREQRRALVRASRRDPQHQRAGDARGLSEADGQVRQAAIIAMFARCP